MHQLLSSIAFLCLLALPLAAQEEALHGTWEGTFVDDFGEGTTRLTFAADGTFALNSNWDRRTLPLGIPFEGEIPDELLDEEDVKMFFSLEGTAAHGTYQVSGDSLWVHIDGDAVEYIVDGESLDFVEFWTPIFRFSSRIIMVSFMLLEDVFEEELSEEELLEKFLTAFEEVVSLDDYQTLDDEALAELFAELEEEPLGPALSGTYAIEGDTLSLTTTEEEDGVAIVETSEFHRIDVASAVVQTTWGGLKAAWRR